MMNTPPTMIPRTISQPRTPRADRGPDGGPHPGVGPVPVGGGAQGGGCCGLGCSDNVCSLGVRVSFPNLVTRPLGLERLRPGDRGTRSFSVRCGAAGSPGLSPPLGATALLERRPLPDPSPWLAGCGHCQQAGRPALAGRRWSGTSCWRASGEGLADCPSTPLRSTATSPNRRRSMRRAASWSQSTVDVTLSPLASNPKSTRRVFRRYRHHGTLCAVRPP